MSKFDTLYENIKWSLRESTTREINYEGSKLFDYIKNLLENLVTRDLFDLPEGVSAETYVSNLLKHQKSPYVFHLDVKQDVPNTQVTITKGESGDQQDDSNVSITVSQEGVKSEMFGGSTPYTDPVDAALSYIDTLVQAKVNAPENAVQQMPAETPETAQPGDQGGASALPGVE